MNDYQVNGKLAGGPRGEHCQYPPKLLRLPCLVSALFLLQRGNPQPYICDHPCLTFPHGFIHYTFISFFLFYYWGGGEGQRERENLEKAPRPVWSPKRGSIL